MKLTAIFQKVPEGYIGFVEELPGANTQGATLDEVRSNLNEAAELVSLDVAIPAEIDEAMDHLDAALASL